jgi:hypothetical protein
VCLPLLRVWPVCRYVIQSLPLMLVGGVAIALVGTRLLQTVQSKVFHTIPFGALSNFNIVDACVGILVSGAFMLYFGQWASALVPLRS